MRKISSNNGQNVGANNNLELIKNLGIQIWRQPERNHRTRFDLKSSYCEPKPVSSWKQLILPAQILLIIVQLSLLTYAIDWLVTALLNLPMLVTIVAVLVISIPAFFILWNLHKRLEKLKNVGN